VYRIETPNLILRPFEESDFDAVHAYAADREVTRYLTWGPNSPAETREFVERAVRLSATPDRDEHEFAIVERASSALVGGCGLYVRRPQFRDYEMGYVLGARNWGRRIGSEAAAHLCRFAFETIGAHRVYALIDPLNGASIAIVERLGFRREGHQRSDTLVSGEWRDTLVYALLEDER